MLRFEVSLKTSKKSTAYMLAVTALISATMSAGKLALAAIPNVEIVTILLATFAFCFGFGYAMTAALVFCLVETQIWGFGTWTVGYLVHWPMVVVVFWQLGRVRRFSNKQQLVFSTAFAVVLTFLFGVMTSVVDTFLTYSAEKGFAVRFDDFFVRFGILYARGLVFFAVHIVSNCLLFSTAFLPLKKVMMLAVR